MQYVSHKSVFCSWSNDTLQDYVAKKLQACSLALCEQVINCLKIMCECFLKCYHQLDPTGEGAFLILASYAPVAQLDRVLVSETKGHRFESCRACQISK